MAKKSVEPKEERDEKKDFFKIWEDSYAIVSKMWDDSYANLYKPWIESTGALFEKAIEISKEDRAENYKEFFDEWMRTYQTTFGKFYPVPAKKLDKEALEKLMKSAEDLNNLFRSWIAELEENSQRTEELFKGAPDPEKYRQYYDMWMRSYEKIFYDFIATSEIESTSEIFEKYTGVPSFYMKNFSQMSKLWRDYYTKQYMPLVDSMLKLFEKTIEISRAETGPEAYREFYNLWMNIYKETYGRLINPQSMIPSKEILESYMKNQDISLSMYKSWIAALEKMSEKSVDIAKRATADPEAYRGFYVTWAKMNERAFEDFFKNTPMVSPMKNLIEPLKNANKMYTDMLNMSSKWMKPTLGEGQT
jgi:hypothetical protein